MNSITDPEALALRTTRKGVYLTLFAVAAFATLLLFFASLSYFRANETQEANNRLSLYEKSLSDNLQRFQHLPYVLSRDSMIINGALNQNLNALNVRLEEFTDKAQLEAIYQLDTNGTVIAASNYAEENTFLHQNYGFRPYFTTALAGRSGEFFGVGATTGRPGYFISEPISDGNGNIVGVIAIKLDMSQLQASWERGGEKILVSNEDGVVVLSSVPDWLYKTTVDLSGEQKVNIVNKRQFGNQALEKLDWVMLDNASVSVGNERFIYASSPASRLNWTVHFLLDERRMYERAALATVLFGIAIVTLLVIATFIRSERIRSALKISQLDRLELITTNKELKSAQTELARSGKLAALGQLSASVTHELGQPIPALRNHLTAAEISGEITSQKTVSKLTAVIDRMDNLTKQLRFFVKPGQEKFEPISINDAVTSAMELVRHDLQAAQVETLINPHETEVKILGNRLRLEQVIVNLILNSMAAMETSEEKKLIINSDIKGDAAILILTDTGSGIGDRSIETLQEPFHTTRASGDGLGLGLSISAEIIRDHNGTMAAENITGGGTIFTLTLPILQTGKAQ
ncbi:MAG: cache domain-containing protein [Pseudomonadota bacterium]